MNNESPESVGKVSTCPVLSSPIFHIILSIKMYSNSGVLAEKASLIVFLMIWGPPNLDLLVNAMKTFVPHVVMKNKNIIPQSGSALVPSLHAEEVRADGKFKVHPNDLRAGLGSAVSLLTVVCQVQGSNQLFSEAGVRLPRLSLPDTHGVGMNRVDPFSGPYK
ncbi:hypothetical protein P3S67_028113 [Capsicum chacoense]